MIGICQIIDQSCLLLKLKQVLVYQGVLKRAIDLNYQHNKNGAIKNELIKFQEHYSK